MWTTWRKPAPTAPQPKGLTPVIRRITNAYTGDSLISQRGRKAALAIWITDLPADCDLNNIEILIEGAPGVPTFIGPADTQNLQQVNAWLPDGVRTGLVPVELRMNGQPVCPIAMARVIPPGPLVPRIVSVTDGVNLVLQNATNTGLVKVQIEEVVNPDAVTALIDDEPVPVHISRIDPRPPRHNLDIQMPPGMAKGSHTLKIRIGPRRFLMANVALC
jgi:hypothetical protein